MRQYFLTKATAERNLEIRRRLRRAKVKKDEDVIISDNSFVHCDFQSFFGGRRVVWYNTLLIFTEQLKQEMNNEKKQRFYRKRL